MQKFYTAQAHNVIRAFDRTGVAFPITKKELLAKAGAEKIKVDFDKTITLEEYCSGITLDAFENKSQFFNALIGSATVL
ncbi:MAG: hypothetical protein LBI99_01955 [Propionibacteriaceae bacterium]|jgi:hypothetical protein|nr:hypothetical protein [Propionibacteriaceae bacterium]